MWQQVAIILGIILVQVQGSQNLGATEDYDLMQWLARGGAQVTPSGRVPNPSS